jgi:hypothetical protein
MELPPLTRELQELTVLKEYVCSNVSLASLIEWKVFEPLIPYPHKTDPQYKPGKKICKECGSEHPTPPEKDIKADMKLYRIEENRLQLLFQELLFFYYNIDINHPKAQLLYSKAWDHCHSSGLQEVVCWFNDLKDLIT